MIYYKKTFLPFQKAIKIIELSNDFLWIENQQYDWNHFQKVNFIVQKKQEKIIHFIEFSIDEQKILINSQELKNFDKTTFLNQLNHCLDSFNQVKENRKQGFSLSPIEKTLDVLYPERIKTFLESNQNSNEYHFLGHDFVFFSTHFSEHEKIMELSKKISTINNPLLENNSLVIGYEKNNITAVLFLTQNGTKLLDEKIFYYDFSTPEFSPILLSNSLQKQEIHEVLKEIQLIEYDIPTEKGCLKWKETFFEENQWNTTHQFQFFPFGTEITISSEFYILTEENKGIHFEYECIFMDSDKKHIDFYKTHHQILDFVIHNLTLSHLKFCEQYWILKMGNNDFFEKCLRKKPN